MHLLCVLMPVVLPAVTQVVGYLVVMTEEADIHCCPRLPLICWLNAPSGIQVTYCRILPILLTFTHSIIQMTCYTALCGWDRTRKEEETIPSFWQPG